MPLVSRWPIGRRQFLSVAGAAVASGLGTKLYRDADERGWRARVMIARAWSYEAELARVIQDGLFTLGLRPLWARGKSVLLKPNLVEPDRQAPHINTHPALVRAAAAVFRSWGASEVIVGEGQGHCRDTDLVLDQSGVGRMVVEEKLEFIDLNHDEVFTHPNRLGRTRLAQLHLPRTLKRADRVVSMPKLKTHHWAGVTLSMKNLFGVMPGICYGWPKNVLHHEGITPSILDINEAVAPDLAIVDGIIGMEGDGPIMGTPRRSGVVVMGTNLPAVDATATRLMGFNPYQVAYLAEASGRLGPIRANHIRQVGESIASARQGFALLDHPSLAPLLMPE